MALNVVVIGTGFGECTAAPAFQALGCKVSVVSPRDARTVEQAISNSCDLVSIHSPPFMHLEHVRMAAERGCHILCDKPFGRNLAEAKQMLDIAERASIQHFLNFEFRFDPLRQKLKHYLDSGQIGQAQHFSSTMFLSRGGSIPHGWLFERERGGGWIGAYVSHEIDALHWLFGDIAECSAQARIDVRHRLNADGEQCEATAEDALCATLRMQNGVTANIDTAFAACFDQPAAFTVMGSDGSVSISNNNQLTLWQRDGAPQTIQAPASQNLLLPAMEQWVGEILRAIETEQVLQPNFYDGVKCAAILEQMRQSL